MRIIIEIDGRGSSPAVRLEPAAVREQAVDGGMPSDDLLQALGADVTRPEKRTTPRTADAGEPPAWLVEVMKELES